MAKLLDLPNELLLDVIDDVCVEDIEAFTSCNKRIHSLSEDILQRHRAMKKKYSKVRVQSWDSKTKDVSGRVHPIVWLHNIMLDETVASYPTHLYIEDWEGYDDPALWDENEDATGISTESKESIFSKLAQCSYIQRKEVQRWKDVEDSSDSDYFDIALALLMTLLPNLRSIIICCLTNYISYTKYMLAQIAKAHQAVQGQRHALSRLVTLVIVKNKYHDSLRTSLDFCLPFTSFPSVLSVSSNITKSRPSSHPSDLPKTFKSGITKIKFTDSDISGLGFEDLLSRIGTLQDFEYEYDKGFHNDFEPYKIVRSLLNHAGHSLRCLHLTGDWYEYYECWVRDSDFVTLRTCVFMGSLRKSQVLKDVRVNHAMSIEIIEEVDTDKKSTKVHRLVDLLPASIENLSLIGTRGLCPLSDLFDGVTELKAQKFPELETIQSEYCDPASRHLKQACHVVGIELVLPTDVAA
ncbi:hypothetical protein IMSHALPRED_003689 [Imshaugia aleurites]|uniref:F-box domain-containing protein n=1 Tax=Imshaugia aleurites TaxID=172621 RepID=A0A8H3PJM0_9LECA|nr:hypothetical protein IMSHALPRED_003689 [Imshaugia aleurites]